MTPSIPENDPLKIHLTRPWRVVIMITLITSFFVLAPTLILYTSGFRYNHATGEFKTTGVISLDIEPQDAKVFVNNNYVGNKQPIRLDGLAPGIYDIRVSKDGYYDFNTVVTLLSHETSYVKGVTLWKKSSPTLQEKTQTTVTNVGINSNKTSEYFFITKDSVSSSLRLVGKDKQTVFTTNKDTEFNCNQEKNHCAWWLKKEKKMQVVSLDDPSTVLSFQAINSNWQWSGSRTTLGFLETIQGIQAIDRNYLQSPISQTSSSLWFVDNQGKKVSVALPDNATKVIDGTNSFALIKIPESIEIITDLTGSAIREIIRTNNYSHQFSNHRWLLWSSSEIISVNDTNGEHGILYRSAEPINQVLGLEPTGSILIVMEKKIMAFNPGYFTTQELATFDAISTVSVSETSRTIIIAGSKGGDQGIYTLTY